MEGASQSLPIYHCTRIDISLPISFSRYFAQPDYQADAVSAYLDFWGDKNKDLFK